MRVADVDRETEFRLFESALQPAELQKPIPPAKKALIRSKFSCRFEPDWLKGEGSELSSYQVGDERVGAAVARLCDPSHPLLTLQAYYRHFFSKELGFGWETESSGLNLRFFLAEQNGEAKIPLHWFKNVPVEIDRKDFEQLAAFKLLELASKKLAMFLIHLCGSEGQDGAAPSSSPIESNSFLGKRVVDYDIGGTKATKVLGASQLREENDLDEDLLCGIMQKMKIKASMPPESGEVQPISERAFEPFSVDPFSDKEPITNPFDDPEDLEPTKPGFMAPIPPGLTSGLINPFDTSAILEKENPDANRTLQPLLEEEKADACKVVPELPASQNAKNNSQDQAKSEIILPTDSPSSLPPPTLIQSNPQPLSEEEASEPTETSFELPPPQTDSASNFLTKPSEQKPLLSAFANGQVNQALFRSVSRVPVDPSPGYFELQDERFKILDEIFPPEYFSVRAKASGYFECPKSLILNVIQAFGIKESDKLLYIDKIELHSSLLTPKFFNLKTKTIMEVVNVKVEDSIQFLKNLIGMSNLAVEVRPAVGGKYSQYFLKGEELPPDKVIVHCPPSKHKMEKAIEIPAMISFALFQFPALFAFAYLKTRQKGLVPDKRGADPSKSLTNSGMNDKTTDRISENGEEKKSEVVDKKILDREIYSKAYDTFVDRVVVESIPLELRDLGRLHDGAKLVGNFFCEFDSNVSLFDFPRSKTDKIGNLDPLQKIGSLITFFNLRDDGDTQAIGGGSQKENAENRIASFTAYLDEENENDLEGDDRITIDIPDFAFEDGEEGICEVAFNITNDFNSKIATFRFGLNLQLKTKERILRRIKRMIVFFCLFQNFREETSDFLVDNSPPELAETDPEKLGLILELAKPSDASPFEKYVALFAKNRKSVAWSFDRAGNVFILKLDGVEVLRAVMAQRNSRDDSMKKVIKAFMDKYLR